QQLVGLDPLALLLPQATEAHGRAQFPRFRLLLTRDGEGLLEAGFRVRWRLGRPRQQQRAGEPMQLRLYETLPDGLDERQRLRQRAQSLFRLPPTCPYTLANNASLCGRV